MATYHYHYDPLDRLIQTAGIQRFYHQSRMTTEIEGTQRYSVFQQDGRLLAQRRRDRTKDECHLLGTDLQQSVLHAVGADKHHSMAYNAYGHRPVENGLISLLGFNGERADPVTGHYLLGNGYRAFNPVLMRFNSPDSWSPFGRGGINSYGYCLGDPINRYDEGGHFSLFRMLGNFLSASRHNAVKLFNTVFKGSKPKLFKNLKPQDMKPEFQNYEKLININPLQRIAATTISTAQDLELLSKHSYSGSFIFTDRRQLVVGDYANHSALSEFAGTDRVISAGELRASHNRFIIENASGHYWPSYESLAPVREYLEGIDTQVQVELIRFTKERYVGPLLRM